MLSYILAIAVALGSLSLYLTTFFKPHLHRKDDFILSGLGLFYALMLWTCSGRITGAVLLGQIAVVSLLSWFTWETLTLRGVFAKPDEGTVISEETKSKIKEISLINLLNIIASKFEKKPVTAVPPKIALEVEPELTSEENIPSETVIQTVTFEEMETVTEPEPLRETLEEITETEKETSLAVPPPTQGEENINKEEKALGPEIGTIEDKKGFSFEKFITGISGIFSKKKSNVVPPIEPEINPPAQEITLENNEVNPHELPREIEELTSEITNPIDGEKLEEVTVMEENQTPLIPPENTVEIEAEITEIKTEEKAEITEILETEIETEITENQEIKKESEENADHEKQEKENPDPN